MEVESTTKCNAIEENDGGSDNDDSCGTNGSATRSWAAMLLLVTMTVLMVKR